MKLTQKKLQDLFYYIDGSLIKKRSGKKVGIKPNGAGYGHVRVGARLYLAHRLIFKFVHGYLPDILDHRDGNKMNNNIANIRPATNQENQRNRGISDNNTSGVTGVNYHINKWRAYIYIDGQYVDLGRFLVKDLAVEARRRAEKAYFGDYAYVE
tara:strand:- start:114 stop:575 length:462 start_codon:yes stop_codon:yes gene_type:complete